MKHVPGYVYAIRLHLYRVVEHHRPDMDAAASAKHQSHLNLLWYHA